jgi:hypothetical protein
MRHRSIAALAPQAGGSGVEQGVAGDALGGALGPGQGIAYREDLDGAIFLAGSALVARDRGVGGNVGGGNGAGSLEQIGLVGLHLDQGTVPGVTDNLEYFFDSAVASTANLLPVRPSAAIMTGRRKSRCSFRRSTDGRG